jgi:hypothetical protein
MNPMENKTFSNSNETCGSVYDERLFESMPITIMALVGILLNCICLNILSKPQFNNLFYKLLSLLAVSDAFFLSSTFLSGVVRSFLVDYSNHLEYSYLVMFYLNVVNRFLGAFSGTTTQVISIDRFIASYYPHTWNNWNTDKNSQRKVFVGYLTYTIINTAFYTAFNTIDERNPLKGSLEKVKMCLVIFNVMLLVILNILVYAKLKKLSSSKFCRVANHKNTYIILFYIAASSIVLYGSITVYRLFVRLCLSENIQSQAYTVVLYLFVFNSTCNFFIYNCTGKIFRETLLETWKMKDCKIIPKNISSTVASKLISSTKSAYESSTKSASETPAKSASDPSITLASEPSTKSVSDSKVVPKTTETTLMESEL